MFETVRRHSGNISFISLKPDERVTVSDVAISICHQNTVVQKTNTGKRNLEFCVTKAFIRYE